MYLGLGAFCVWIVGFGCGGLILLLGFGVCVDVLWFDVGVAFILIVHFSFSLEADTYGCGWVSD